MGLYYLFEEGQDAGMVVGGDGFNFDPDTFEDEAEAEGHPTEVLLPVGDTALRGVLLANS